MRVSELLGKSVNSHDTNARIIHNFHDIINRKTALERNDRIEVLNFRFARFNRVI